MYVAFEVCSQGITRKCTDITVFLKFRKCKLHRLATFGDANCIAKFQLSQHINICITWIVFFTLWSFRLCLVVQLRQSLDVSSKVPRILLFSAYFPCLHVADVVECQNVNKSPPLHEWEAIAASLGKLRIALTSAPAFSLANSIAPLNLRHSSKCTVHQRAISRTTSAKSEGTSNQPGHLGYENSYLCIHSVTNSRKPCVSVQERRDIHCYKS